MDIPLAAKFRQSKIAYFTIATLYARAKQQPNSSQTASVSFWYWRGLTTQRIGYTHTHAMIMRLETGFLRFHLKKMFNSYFRRETVINFLEWNEFFPSFIWCPLSVFIYILLPKTDFFPRCDHILFSCESKWIWWW